jgi:hypothetical protein
MARVESNKQKRTILFPLTKKVDLVYYFAIHKEDESKNKNIVYRSCSTKSLEELRKKRFVFLCKQLIVELYSL